MKLTTLKSRLQRAPSRLAHRGPKDSSPVQIISAEQLAHYQRIEAAHQALLQGIGALLSAQQA